MASSVYYKFKSQRDESRVTFDGTGISVFDLKKEIILQNNLKAQDIDLLVFDSANQEYKDDAYIIPRSTSVIAKRMPAIRPGRGRAAIYVAGIASAGPSDSVSQSTTVSSAVNRANAFGPSSGSTRYTGSMSKRFDGRDDRPPAPPSSSSNPAATSSRPATSTGDDEADAIAAMFAATSEQWEETQEQMAHAKPVYNNRPQGFRRPFNNNGQQQQQPHQPAEARPTPLGYICHRCGRKGHWIQDCPTNDDPVFDNRPRIKRTTGIPKSFLQTVEMSNGAAPLQGVMVTPEGGYVRAQPDSAAWQRHVTRPKALTEVEVRERPPTDPALVCPYPECGKLFRRAVKTPCCSTTYCEECIQTHLLEKDFQCPKCKAKIPSLDKLMIDKDARDNVRKYIDKAIEDSKHGDAPPKANEAQGGSDHDATPSASQEEEYTEFQPGSESQDGQYGGFGEAFDPQQNVTQLQAQLAQLMLMIQNPTLPLNSKMQLQMRIQNLTAALHQAEMIAAQASFGGMNVGMGMMNPMGGMGMMGGGIPGLGMVQADGMNGPGGFPMQQQSWNNQMKWNAYGMPQPIGDDSAYQRLPINNRRKNLKRERPTDFVEVGSDPKRQYWE